MYSFLSYRASLITWFFLIFFMSFFEQVAAAKLLICTLLLYVAPTGCLIHKFSWFLISRHPSMYCIHTCSFYVASLVSLQKQDQGFYSFCCLSFVSVIIIFRNKTISSFSVLNIQIAQMFTTFWQWFPFLVISMRCFLTNLFIMAC